MYTEWVLQMRWVECLRMKFSTLDWACSTKHLIIASKFEYEAISSSLNLFLELLLYVSLVLHVSSKVIALPQSAWSWWKPAIGYVATLGSSYAQSKLPSLHPCTIWIIPISLVYLLHDWGSSRPGLLLIYIVLCVARNWFCVVSDWSEQSHYTRLSDTWMLHLCS